jgi:replicative DNA helicase
LSLIVIDHLGLISRAGRNDASELGQVTTAFKALAKELNIPVVLLCQLNRKVEERSDKRPMLSDLRDSGRIEEDADIVIFLNRPEYYNLQPFGYCEFIVAKARDGETGSAWAKSKLANMRLESCDEPESVGSTASANESRGFSPRNSAANQPREFSRNHWNRG